MRVEHCPGHGGTRENLLGDPFDLRWKIRAVQYPECVLHRVLLYGDVRMKRPQTTDRRLQSRRGFTLIELLVAMAILVVITLIVARVFQQAGVAWDTGTRKAEAMMSGRAVSDFLAQQLSCAVADTNGIPFNVTGSPLEFYVLGDAGPGTRAIQRVQYAASQLAYGLSDSDIEVTTYGAVGNELPVNGFVTVAVYSPGTMTTNRFQAGFYFNNRNRNRL